MGLGKTLTSIALILKDKQLGFEKKCKFLSNHRIEIFIFMFQTVIQQAIITELFQMLESTFDFSFKTFSRRTNDIGLFKLFEDKKRLIPQLFSTLL